MNNATPTGGFRRTVLLVSTFAGVYAAVIGLVLLGIDPIIAISTVSTIVLVTREIAGRDI